MVAPNDYRAFAAHDWYCPTLGRGRILHPHYDTDGYWYDTAYVGDLDQQYSDLVAVTFDDHPDAFKEWNNIDINARWTAGYGGLDYVHAGNKTKAFRKEVETLLTDIKRVSPAGSASFELAKDFMDTHYGEEG